MNYSPTRVFISPLLVLLLALMSTGCGSTGSNNTPDRPDPVITAVSQIVDVGASFSLDALQSSEAKDRELTFTWRLIGASDELGFDDHCDTDFSEICTTNDDDTCTSDPSTFCDTNSDCAVADICNHNSATTSSQCTTGICLIDRGGEGDEATFTATSAGPFQVRLTAESSVATSIESIILDTFPSLYVVGSLVELGGTAGGFVEEVADAQTFTPNAIAAAVSPTSGNILVIDGGLGVVRDFDSKTNTLLGQFGEVDSFVDNPVALAFSSDDSLFVVAANGDVSTFDATSGLITGQFANVGVGVTAVGFSPLDGNFLVANGGAGIEVYTSAGAANGILGTTDTATTNAVDLAFMGDPATVLLIADAAGDVVRCNADGTSCASFGDVGSLLAAGSPSAISVNPSIDREPDAAVLVADPVAARVLVCDETGIACTIFGDSADLDSDYNDLVFAPAVTPTTTSTSTTTSTLPTTTSTLP